METSAFTFIFSFEQYGITLLQCLFEPPTCPSERLSFGNKRSYRRNKELKSEPGKPIIAFGGAGFMRSLIAARLVDPYVLVTHPAMENDRGELGVTIHHDHSPFSILNSQFSILHSSFSILHSSFSILNSPFSILHSTTLVPSNAKPIPPVANPIQEVYQKIPALHSLSPGLLQLWRQ